MDERVIIDLASGLHGPLARDERYPQTSSVVPPSRAPPLSKVSKSDFRKLNQRRKRDTGRERGARGRLVPLTISKRRHVQGLFFEETFYFGGSK